MDIKHNISEELREIAPTIASLGKHNTYTAPLDYFDSLSSVILKRITTIVPANKKIRDVYEVPANYFEGLANNILQKIQSQKPLSQSNEVYKELLEIAPLLATVSKENLFSVPYGYFDTFGIKHPQKSSTKVISIAGSIRRLAAYAAASSILFILTTASYLYVNHHIRSIDKSPTIEQRLADLDDSEIIDYLKYDQETGDLNPSISEQDPDIDHLLINTSDEEIKNYLDEGNEANEKKIKGI